MREEVARSISGFGAERDLSQVLPRRQQRDAAAALHEAVVEDADLTSHRVAGIEVGRCPRDRFQSEHRAFGAEMARSESADRSSWVVGVSECARSCFHGRLGDRDTTGFAVRVQGDGELAIDCVFVTTGS